MAEGKLRAEDKDEWIFSSMDRYTHLNMFDLEFPVDAFEIINDSSLCLAGLQTYSKNCELVQLSIPPKLLPENMEDGLCKDRDFNILSGGYSSHRITQIKAVHSERRLLATVQSGRAGVSLFELGDENHAVIIPKGNLTLPRLASASLIQVIGTKGNQIVLGNNFGKTINEWKVDSSLSSTTCLNHSISEDLGGIVKVKFWNENSVIFSTNNGKVAIYDLRGLQIGMEVQSSKSLKSEPSVVDSIKEIPVIVPTVKNVIDAPKSPKTGSNEGTAMESKGTLAVKDKNGAACAVPIEIPKQSGITPTLSTVKKEELSQSESMKTEPSLIWSFDSVPDLHKIGIVDSCGGYETFDIRKASSGAKPLIDRKILPGCSAMELLGQKFNIEYEPYRGFGSEVKFVVSGMKDENIHIYSDRVVGGTTREVTPVFTHDGHSSTVTHCLWHPLTKNLLFSTAANSTLHAWQYIQR